MVYLEVFIAGGLIPTTLPDHKIGGHIHDGARKRTRARNRLVVMYSYLEIYTFVISRKPFFLPGLTTGPIGFLL